MIDELFARLDGAYAPTTLRAYRTDFTQYCDWCAAHDKDPLALPDADFVVYLEEKALTRRSSTIRRHVASLSRVLRLAGGYDVTQSVEADLALKRMHRKKGRAQKQAVPLTRNVLDALLAVCEDNQQGRRDRLLLHLGYETLRRRAELCSFRFEDLEVLPNGKAALHLRFSKTDQYGDGKLIPISPALLAEIRAWGEPLGMTGYLLRRIYGRGVIGHDMDPASINRRLQALQARAGLELSGRLTGHSFRVGAALDLLEAGVPIEKIMLLGGWKSQSTVISYLRAWQAHAWTR